MAAEVVVAEGAAVDLVAVVEAAGAEVAVPQPELGLRFLNKPHSSKP